MTSFLSETAAREERRKARMVVEEEAARIVSGFQTRNCVNMVKMTYWCFDYLRKCVSIMIPANLYIWGKPVHARIPQVRYEKIPLAMLILCKNLSLFWENTLEFTFLYNNTLRYT